MNLDETSLEPNRSLLLRIAANITAARKQSGMSQEELAHRAGIDRTYIGYIENAKFNVSISKLSMIADALEVPLVALLIEGASESPLARLNALFPFVRLYQALAKSHADIVDIFQDNGGKLLQVLIVTGLQNLPDREGNDAVDPATGKEFELKSVNASLTTSFSTHHHLNPTILEKYRKVDWIFAVYENSELQKIYLMNSDLLEPYFAKWESKWHKSGGKDINNPKIPLRFVEKEGKLIYEAQSNGQFRFAKF